MEKSWLCGRGTLLVLPCKDNNFHLMMMKLPGYAVWASAVWLVTKSTITKLGFLYCHWLADEYSSFSFFLLLHTCVFVCVRTIVKEGFQAPVYVCFMYVIQSVFIRLTSPFMLCTPLPRSTDEHCSCQTSTGLTPVHWDHPKNVTHSFPLESSDF